MADAKTEIETPILDREEMEIYVRDVEIQREMFRDFFGHAPKLLREMRAAVAIGARLPWRENAHAIKGTALYLGLRRVIALTAPEMEEGARPTSAKLRRLEAELAAAKQAADAYLATVDR